MFIFIVASMNASWVVENLYLSSGRINAGGSGVGWCCPTG